MLQTNCAKALVATLEQRLGRNGLRCYTSAPQPSMAKQQVGFARNTRARHLKALHGACLVPACLAPLTKKPDVRPFECAPCQGAGHGLTRCTVGRLDTTRPEPAAGCGQTLEHRAARHDGGFLEFIYTFLFLSLCVRSAWPRGGTTAGQCRSLLEPRHHRCAACGRGGARQPAQRSNAMQKQGKLRAWAVKATHRVWRGVGSALSRVGLLAR